MNISAILVVVPMTEIGATTASLEALPGVEVRHTDAATGRLLVIQEAADVGAEVAGLQRIKALPAVGLAEMVYHYFEDDPEIAASRSQVLQERAAPYRLPAALCD